jgi:hypothetical protein
VLDRRKWICCRWQVIRQSLCRIQCQGRVKSGTTNAVLGSEAGISSCVKMADFNPRHIQIYIQTSTRFGYPFRSTWVTGIVSKKSVQLVCIFKTSSYHTTKLLVWCFLAYCNIRVCDSQIKTVFLLSDPIRTKLPCMKRNGRDLFKVLSRHLLLGTEEKFPEPQCSRSQGWRLNFRPRE